MIPAVGWWSDFIDALHEVGKKERPKMASAIRCIVGKEPVAKPQVCIDLEDTTKGSIAVILRDPSTKVKVATLAKIGKRTGTITVMRGVPSKYGFKTDYAGRVNTKMA